MSLSGVAVKLSEHRQHGCFKCFKKTIGRRNFYFTKSREQSERMAMSLLASWAQLRSRGYSCWTEQAIRQAYRLVGEEEQITPAEPTSNSAPARCEVRATSSTVYQAVDEYLADYRRKVSHSRYQRQATALRSYKRFQDDLLLSAIDCDKLNTAVAHYRSRPTCHSTGNQMSVATVQTQLKAIHAFYDWLDLSERWEAPRRFDRLFRVNYRKLKTSDELRNEASGAITFTLDELTTLWSLATARQRLYLGLALNIGETAQGLADLQKVELKNVGCNMVIDRSRGKTGVRGVYVLWPEVADLVVAERDQNPSEPRLFATQEGKPLVWFHETGRVDSIAKTWAVLLERCDDVRDLGFKYLRKTGASMVEEISGNVETAQLYLCHVGPTVAQKHYLARHFTRLDEALAGVHERLSQMFSASASSGAAA